MKIYFAGGGVSDKCNDNIKFNNRLLSFYFLSISPAFILTYKLIFKKIIERKNENLSRVRILRDECKR